MDRLLSVADVAEVLGLSRFTVYAWASKRRLPAIKVGSRLMFRRPDLEAWLELRSRGPGGEPGVSRASVAPTALGGGLEPGGANG